MQVYVVTRDDTELGGEKEVLGVFGSERGAEQMVRMERRNINRDIYDYEIIGHPLED